MKKLALLALLLVVAGCGDGLPVEGSSDAYSFRHGPDGLYCVFVTSGNGGNSATMAMDCDWSKYTGSRQ